MGLLASTHQRDGILGGLDTAISLHILQTATDGGGKEN